MTSPLYFVLLFESLIFVNFDNFHITSNQSILFSYVKKVIEEAQLTEDTLKLLQFICWENPHMSKIVLAEVLWQVAFAYCNELKHHIELLLALLRMEDSWQTHRLSNALRGKFSLSQKKINFLCSNEIFIVLF